MESDCLICSMPGAKSTRTTGQRLAKYSVSNQTVGESMIQLIGQPLPRLINWAPFFSRLVSARANMRYRVLTGTTTSIKIRTKTKTHMPTGTKPEQTLEKRPKKSRASKGQKEDRESGGGGKDIIDRLSKAFKNVQAVGKGRRNV
jgi:hypothetical protein